MKKLFKTLLISILSVMMLVSCQQKKVNLSYTVYPVQYLIERIGGDHAEAFALSDEVNVMRSTLTEDYIEVLKKADTIFIIGGLEPYLDIINQNIQDYQPEIIDLGAKGALVPFERYTTVLVDNVEVVAESRYYDNPVFDNIDTYTNDPYIWLDPIMMTSMANEVLAYFVNVDPQNKSFYEKNFEEVKMELAYLDADYSQLKKLKGVSFASMVPAFGRYANNYGFRMSPVIISKYGNLPNASQLEVIKARLQMDNVQYLIVEAGLDKDIMDLANEIKDDLNIELVYLSSLSARTAEQIENGEDYLHIMNQNLAELKKIINIKE